ncbi:MFS transporter [Pseudovirgaria hyperparasitica]|uniref:MFS transporter n=1 Tax=Pseudovirgaria hyperparasitica TaxID=470096 RepID=A0A6A6VUR7_9PEZI|nr:MFS transporter [Pseudovirgaria hyperparasitica]KAF2753001.1 MFS transporter [Pseudovirgaria hyperparasitica]
MDPQHDSTTSSEISSQNDKEVEEGGSNVNTEIDPEAEKKLLRKLDYTVLPILCWLYVLTFLDRINLGNARIAGLEASLGMSGNDYNVATCVFFVTYCIFELPSNIVMKYVAPSTWMALLAFLWGTVTVLTGIVQNYSGLIACRIFLGLFDAGFMPGAAYLMSMYYKRHELSIRFNTFFAASVFAGAFGGLLAYGLTQLDGRAGLEGWRWIFIVEGLITVVTAFVAKYFVADWPQQNRFLSAEEKALLAARLAQDNKGAGMERLDKKAVKRIFTDWKIPVAICMYIPFSSNNYSLAIFIPTILNSMGYHQTRAQVLSIPIYVAACTVCIIVAFCSDKTRHRYAYIMGGLMFSVIGFAILLAQSTSLGVQYMAIVFAACGGYTAHPLVVTWLTNNMGGRYKRSFGTGLLLGFGNAGGIIASNIFIESERPRYLVGYGVCLAVAIFSAVMSSVFIVGLRRENRKRDAGGRDYRFEFVKEELENLGDSHPEFRFVY